MDGYWITFSSITPAQRGEGVLKRNHIFCSLRRAPRWMEARGCGYSLQVRPNDWEIAVALLKNENISFRKVYKLRPDGQGEEVGFL